VTIAKTPDITKKLPITITEDPLSTVVLGSGKTLDNLSILKQVTVK